VPPGRKPGPETALGNQAGSGRARPPRETGDKPGALLHTPAMPRTPSSRRWLWRSNYYPENSPIRTNMHHGGYRATGDWARAQRVFILSVVPERMGVSIENNEEPRSDAASQQIIGGELAWRQHDGGHEVTPNWPAFFEWWRPISRRRPSESSLGGHNGSERQIIIDTTRSLVPFVLAV